LRAPSYHLVSKWGKKLKLSADEIKTVNSKLLIRSQLGMYFDWEKNSIKYKYFNDQDQSLECYQIQKNGKK
jgi:hypothetical protein